MKKFSLLLTIIILLSSFVSAQLTANNELYLSLDATFNDLASFGGNNSFNNNGLTNTTNAILVTAMNCGGAGFADNLFAAGTTYSNVSINAWINTTDANAGLGTIFGRFPTSGASGRMTITVFNSKLFTEVEGNSATSSASVDDGVYHMITLTCEAGVNCKLYIDAVNTNNISYDGVLGVSNNG